jgi:hypothetical protein
MRRMVVPSEVYRQQRRRYPWDTWGVPGSGPYHVADTEVPRRHLAGVLRTWSARRGIPVRMRQDYDGLLFQFGPPFAASMAPAELVDVKGTLECPVCQRPYRYDAGDDPLALPSLEAPT